MIDGTPVSVLISSRNRPEFLLDVVRSVLAGSSVPDEIVIVDQSERPNTDLQALLLPREVSMRYVHSRTIGLSRSRNIAFANASHPVVVVIDDDCLAAEDWLATIVRAVLAAGSKVVVTGRVLASKPTDAATFAPSLHTSEHPALFRGKLTTDPLATFNFALHASTFAAVGGFDPRIGPGTRFPAAEDNDYGYRLLRMGYAIAFEPAALVYHRSWRARNAYIALRYAYGRGQGGYYGKHLAARDPYMVWKFVHALKRRGKRMLEGDMEGVAGELAWIAGFVVGAIDWLSRAPLTSERAAADM